MALQPTKFFALLLACALLFAGVAEETPSPESADESAVAAPVAAGEADADAGDAPAPPEAEAAADAPAPPEAEAAAADEPSPSPEESAVADGGAGDGSVESVEEKAVEESIAVPAVVDVQPAENVGGIDMTVGAVREERQARVIVVPSSEAKSISAAMVKARPGDTVRVKNGTYRETILMTPGVALVAENLFKAVLDGRGRNTVVTMSNNSTIEGFEIRRGTIGVFSTSSHATIRRNRIAHNVQSGVMCVGTLPKMEDNFIVFNRGSGIQGWDVRTTSGSINHNTIAFNTNHGISLGGTTSITVENNIIAFNDQFGIKPGEETVRVELINNNFFRNARISSTLPSDNISADPMFVDPKRFNFNLTEGSASIGMGTDNQNLGARILH